MNTVKININYLVPPALDWAVSKCEGVDDYILSESFMTRWTDDEGVTYNCSTDWAQGGPIIEREGMQLQMEDISEWHATMWWDDGEGQREVVTRGPTPLIAAMRCYVASQLGDEVEIPGEIGASHELVD